MSGTPKEVQEMHTQLAEVKRDVRGVKQEWRNLRSLPKSRRLAAVTEADLARYDSQHPPQHSDDTTARLGGVKR